MIAGLTEQEWQLLSEEDRRRLAYDQELPEPVRRARQEAQERAFEQWRQQHPVEDPAEREKAREEALLTHVGGIPSPNARPEPVGRDDMGWVG